MSPTPRKPAKPKRATEEQQAALKRALAEGGQTAPPPDVAIRMSAKAPSAAALKKLGIKDVRVAELAAHLEQHGQEIAEQLRDDRELAELLATDPAAALKRLNVPKELRTGGEDQARNEFLDRFRGVKIELPAESTLPDPGRVSPAMLAAVQLIADTFAAAAADATQFATLKTDPLGVVTAVAVSKPPQGLGAGSAAAASVVREVSDQVGAVYGAPATLRPSPGTTIRLPRPPKGS